MGLVSEDIAKEHLHNLGAEVHHLQVTQDRQVIIFRANYRPHENTIRSIPALFVTLCISGGGFMKQRAGPHEIVGEIATGDIGIVPPRSSGWGQWPELSVITIGVAVEAVAESFGNNWPEKLRKSTLSQVFRDPLAEATMMDMGYTRAGKIADATLFHAAHMITHQLLDRPFDETVDDGNLHPLSKTSIARIADMLAENMDRHVSVQEMADIVNISRHHFSRRFKATTGQTPHQYAIQRKMDHAAELLAQDDQSSVISIAQLLGYSNPAQFAQLFRRHFGLAPRHWRRHVSK